MRPHFHLDISERHSVCLTHKEIRLEKQSLLKYNVLVCIVGIAYIVW